MDEVVAAGGAVSPIASIRGDKLPGKSGQGNARLRRINCHPCAESTVTDAPGGTNVKDEGEAPAGGGGGGGGGPEPLVLFPCTSLSLLSLSLSLSLSLDELLLSLSLPLPLPLSLPSLSLLLRSRGASSESGVDPKSMSESDIFQLIYFTQPIPLAVSGALCL